MSDAGLQVGRAEPPQGELRRIPALDGLRGLMTLMVIVSHFFGEVEHGLRGLMVGWMAVFMYFVLSGYLIGRLILQKQDRKNFFAVFYVRRLCRLGPPYLLTIAIVGFLLARVPADWRDADVAFPLWSYVLFLQNFWMVATDSIGAHWLAPTWTLGVEEHFYLVAPAVIVFAPRRWLVPLMLGACGVALALRFAVFGLGFGNRMVGLALSPSVADALAIGVLLAIALEGGAAPWRRWPQALSFLPAALLVGVMVLHSVDLAAYDILTPLVVSLACAAVLACAIGGLPVTQRMNSRVLQWFGDNSYCLYLTHLPVLGLMHGLILGTRPDLATGAQWAVTVAALPVAVLVGWLMTALIEEPCMRYGRSWKWSAQARTPRRAIPHARQVNAP